MDQSIVMRGVARVLTDAGARVQEYARASHLLCVRAGAAAARADVVVLSLGGQHRSHPWIRSLTARYRVLVFGPRLAPSTVAELVRIGVRGFVIWDATAERLVDAVRTVAATGLYLPPFAAGQGGRETAPHVLTLREREVLQSVSSGLTHKEVARTLGLSKTTVDTYVQRIRQKLGVGNKAELARAAYRFGLCVDD